MNDDFKRPLGPNPKVQQAEPVENEPPVALAQPSPQVKEKKKYSKAFSFVSILLLLALLGTGVMTYFWYDAQNRLDDAQAQVATLETSLAAVSQAENLPAAVEPSADEAITNAAREYVQLMQGDTKSYTYNIEKSDQNFAVVSFGDETVGVGAMMYLVNAPSGSIDGQNWIVIYDGQNIPPQEIIDKFAIPDEFLVAGE